MFEDDPLAPNTHQPFDAILAPQCLTCLQTKENAGRAVKNLSTNYLKPGGYFLTIGVLGPGTSYVVGEITFDSFNITVEEFQTLHEDAGLTIKGVYPFNEKDETNSDVVDVSIVTIIAQRPEV